MSAKTDILNTIKAKLGADVPVVKTFGYFNDQFAKLDDGQEPPFAFPAVFLEYQDIEWDRTGQATPQSNSGQEQKGNVRMVLHIGFWQLDHDPEAFMQTVDEIYHKLHLLRGSYFGPMQRRGERSNHDHGNVLVWEMEFEALAQEPGAQNNMVDAEEVTISVSAITD